jgi:hypothetical protein
MNTNGDGRLLKAVQDRLRSTRPELACLECEINEGVVLIKGTVYSFYIKQCAQESLRNLDGIAEIRNRLNVAEDIAEDID